MQHLRNIIENDKTKYVGLQTLIPENNYNTLNCSHVQCNTVTGNEIQNVIFDELTWDIILLRETIEITPNDKSSTVIAITR